MTYTEWEKDAAGWLPEMLRLRRKLHAQPELSGQEKATADIISSTLKDIGLDVVRFTDCYAVMGLLRNGEGGCVAIRADMDALPINENSGLDFASRCPGVMHACGHDMHMTIALGVARWLASHRDRWHGTVKFLFEPAEETDGGAKWMVEQGCMENPKVDAVLGQHMNPNYAPGVFFCKPCAVSGASDMVEITVHGKACHGAYPERGVDAIVAAAQIVTALQSLVSRSLSPFESAVLSLGKIHGGEAGNIVCDHVVMTGTLRTLNDTIRNHMHAEIERIATHTAAAYRASAEVAITPGYGAVTNDPALYSMVEANAVALLGKDKLVRREAPSLGVESFCYFVAKTPGVYYDIGCGIGSALHTSTFVADEACLLPAIALQCENVLSLLV